MATSPSDRHQEWGRKLEAYCKRYSVPIEHFFEIINDQKVLPMLRGKGMEYNVELILKQTLNPAEWVVQKLNVNAQPGTPDQDIGITHKRTAIQLIAESKSAVRGSMRSGLRSKKDKVPQFSVKCHRSRSNKKLASNDRYAVNAFDVLISNPSNALYLGKTIGEELEIQKDPVLIPLLYAHYHVENPVDLLEATLTDWRFVFPSEIAENGFIPRAPKVLLADDPRWQPLSKLESNLFELVKQKHAKK